MDWNRSLLGRAVAATAVIASCVTFGAPPAASSDPGTGSISGTVLDDQGMPLGGVCVYAQNVTGTMTGPGGTYLIDNVPAGQHRVQFSDCNPAPTYLTQWYLGAADESTAALVNVADQANTALADVHMVPGVSVTGTVTDTANSPLQDIRVELQPQDPPNDYISGYTDSNGQYRTGPVKDGQYKVRFVDNRYPAQYAAEFWNDEYLEADAQSLDLRVANGTLVTGIDAQLGDGATIAGNVRDQDSSPLSQVCVNAMTPHPDDHHLAGANTDASGNYSISGLPPVSTVVSFHDCNSPATHADQWYDGVTDRDDAQHLSLSPGTTLNGIDAQMTLGATISGKVTGTGGAPAANICVQAVTGTDDDWNSVGWAQTDASGNYELERLPPGTHRVNFEDCNDTGPYLEQWYSGSDSFDRATTIELTAGQSRTGVNVQLQPAALITGTVTDTGGTPLEGTCVQATTDSFVGGMAETGSDGTYSITLSRSGKYKVQFVDCGDQNAEPPIPGGTYLAQWWGGGLEPASAKTVEVSTGATVDSIDAKLTTAGGTGTVSGRITNVRGEPLEACVALYLPFDHVRFVQTDADGRYAFSDVPTGTWTLAFVGCGSDDVAPVIPDTGATGVFFNAVWYDGVPLELGDKGPDPITQGATLITIAPKESFTADVCFGCGSVTVKPPEIGKDFILVDFDTTGLAPDGGLNARAGNELTYSVGCESTKGTPTSASQGSFPVKVSGFTPGAPYVCSARILSNGVEVADSTTFEVTVGSATPAAPDETDDDPTTPSQPGDTGGDGTGESIPASSEQPVSSPVKLAYTGSNTVAMVTLAVFLILIGAGAVAATMRTTHRQQRRRATS